MNQNGAQVAPPWQLIAQCFEVHADGNGTQMATCTNYYSSMDERIKHRRGALIHKHKLLMRVRNMITARGLSDDDVDMDSIRNAAQKIALYQFGF